MPSIQQQLDKSALINVIYHHSFGKKTMFLLAVFFVNPFTNNGVQGRINCATVDGPSVCNTEDNTFLCDSSTDKCWGGLTQPNKQIVEVEGTTSMCKRYDLTTSDPICDNLVVSFSNFDLDPQGMICDGKTTCYSVAVYFGDQTNKGTITCNGPEACDDMDVYYPSDAVDGIVTCKGGSIGAPSCPNVNIYGGCLVCEGHHDCYNICVFDAGRNYFVCFENKFFQGAIGPACTEDNEMATKPAVPACFSGLNTVEDQDRGVVTMDSLAIGDFVNTGFSQDGHPQFSRLISFMHMNVYATIEYLQISTNIATDMPLEISGDHFLYLRNGKVIKAKNVQIGDILKGINSPITVTNIQQIQRQGLYAPVTENGKICVSGVLASSYISMLDDQIISSNMQVLMSHIALAPLRLMCNHGSFSMCKNESYSVDGYSTNLSDLIQFGMHFMALASGKQLLMVIVSIPFLLILASLEIAFNHGMMVSMLTVGLLVPTLMYNKYTKSLVW